MGMVTIQAETPQITTQITTNLLARVTNGSNIGTTVPKHIFIIILEPKKQVGLRQEELMLGVATMVTTMIAHTIVVMIVDMMTGMEKKRTMAGTMIGKSTTMNSQ